MFGRAGLLASSPISLSLLWRDSQRSRRTGKEWALPVAFDGGGGVGLLPELVAVERAKQPLDGIQQLIDPRQLQQRPVDGDEDEAEVAGDRPLERVGVLAAPLDTCRRCPAAPGPRSGRR